MSIPKLLHIRSAVIGAQLAALAMQGKGIPQDTAENLVLSQLGAHDLKRFDGDLTTCGPASQNKADIRRGYAFKVMECLLVRVSDPMLLTDDEMEKILRRCWRAAAIMEEEDQVALQLSSVRGQ